jgi:hypothetical protein
VKFKQRVKRIMRTLALLLARGSIAELRVPKADGGPLVGLFNDFDAMAIAAARQSGKAPGVYVLLNQPKQSVARRVDNRLVRATTAVKDVEIERRQWLPIDFDPVRPSNTPSTEAEHEAAIAMAKDCRTWLRDRGWPEPLLADSGNGAHLLYRIDLPNDTASRELVKSVLEVISLKFSDAQVSVDIGNFNASRIWRVYGTYNVKGEETEQRPYRRAQLLEVPDEIEIVSREKMKKLGAAFPVPSKDVREDQLDVIRWIEGNKVPVLSDAPWNVDGHKWILQCPWNKSHDNKSAYIVQFSDGNVAAGCLHKSCKGNDWPALRSQFEQESGATSQLESAPSVAQTENLSGGRKPKQAGIFLGLGSELEFFRTPQGETYATVQTNGHKENHPIKSKAFDQFLRHRYFTLTGTAPRPQAVHEAVSHFDAVARFNSPTKPVFVRVAEAGGLNYLDLCDEKWRSIEFGPAGWRIVETPAVKFRRTPGMLPLPTPVGGGDINELRGFLNLRSDESWILLVSTLLQALLPRGPYPVLCLHGEAGSAKSTSSRVFRMLVDPNTSPTRAMPKEVRDLAIAANNSAVLIFDNLSYLSPTFSDCLCRLSTGGGFTTRQLYTDADEILFDGQRPIVLNGVEELASRTDLVDRSIILELPLIERYEPEREFWKRFEEAHSRLLGALLDAVVGALGKLPEVRLRETPRMADFATFATAAESALGFSKGAFMSAYKKNRLDANAVALEASPIASVVCDLVRQTIWEGTAKDLLRKLSEMAEEEVRKSRGWPKSPKMLSGMLRRLATALRRAGVEVGFSRANNAQRTRKITINRMGIRKEKKSA